jgi:F0F1-type ATP synthase assembly protein I
MVNNTIEANIEAGVALSLFTLFIGITIDRIIDQKPIDYLFLTTAIFLGITIYFYSKVIGKIREIEKNKDKSKHSDNIHQRQSIEETPTNV